MEMWKNDPGVCTMVFEAFCILNEAQEIILHLQQEQEEELR